MGWVVPCHSEHLAWQAKNRATVVPCHCTRNNIVQNAPLLLRSGTEGRLREAD